MLKENGFPNRSQVLGITAGMGVVKTLTLFVTMALLDRPWAGRRRLLLISYASMMTSLFLLAISVYAASQAAIVLCIYAYVIAFSVGAGPICWLFASEILPTSVRAKGMTFAGGLNRFGGAIISISFLSA